MGMKSVRDQIYIHGFDNFDSIGIKFLKSKGLWRDEQVSQDTQPVQPGLCDYLILSDGNVAHRMNPAHQEPVRRVSVMDLLN